MPAWIGYKSMNEPEYFWSQKKPTEESHGGKYIMVTGPFKNKKEAEEAYASGER